MRTRKSTTSALFLFIGLAFASAAQAFMITNDPSLPPVGGAYLSPAQVHATYNGPGLQVILQDIKHSGFTNIVHTPQGANEREDFDSTVDGNASVNGSPLAPVTALGPVTVEVFGKTGNVTGTFNTEMLSMNLSGNSPFGPIMIRESPTLPSLGQTTITDQGGGLYRIDSFFDVFTELSIDGGQTWIPDSTGPTRVDLGVPEPATLGLLLIGVLGLRRRR